MTAGLGRIEDRQAGRGKRDRHLETGGGDGGSSGVAGAAGGVIIPLPPQPVCPEPVEGLPSLDVA